MDDVEFEEMAKAYEHEFPIDQAFVGAKYDKRIILRNHEYIERKRLRIAIENLVTILGEKKK